MFTFTPCTFTKTSPGTSGGTVYFCSCTLLLLLLLQQMWWYVYQDIITALLVSLLQQLLVLIQLTTIRKRLKGIERAAGDAQLSEAACD